MSHVERGVAGAQKKQSWRMTKYKSQQGPLLLCLLGTLQEIVKVGGFLSSMEIYSGKEAAWAGNEIVNCTNVWFWDMHQGVNVVT